MAGLRVTSGSGSAPVTLSDGLRDNRPFSLLQETKGTAGTRSPPPALSPCKGWDLLSLPFFAGFPHAILCIAVFFGDVMHAGHLWDWRVVELEGTSKITKP